MREELSSVTQKQTNTERVAGSVASKYQEADSTEVYLPLDPKLSSLSDSSPGWRREAARG